MEALISIIVPVYNEEKYLPRCVNSILNQSHQNIELILINDGSTDTSLDICLSYKEKDQRVVVIDQNNQGVSAARNAGLNIATGKYVGFVDSDDYIHPEMYHKMLAKLTQESTKICVIQEHTINLIHEVLASPLSVDRALELICKMQLPISLWSYLYEREVVTKYRLSNDIHYLEDFDFNLRVLLGVDRISICPEKKLYMYCVNDGSINSQDINDKRLSSFLIYENALEQISSNRPKIQKTLVYFLSQCIISVIISIIKTNKVDRRYYQKTRMYIREHMRTIFMSIYVPALSKSLIAAFYCLPRTTRLFVKQLKYR